MGDSDFGFYGEGYDENTDSEIKGITDTVTDFVYTGLNYPNIIIKEGFTCPKHKMQVLSRMVKSSSREIKDVNLYFVQGGELYKMGMLSKGQVMAFLDMVGIDMLDAFLDEKTKLEGDRIYVLG